jgi:hypothetical protein
VKEQTDALFMEALEYAQQVGERSKVGAQCTPQSPTTSSGFVSTRLGRLLGLPLASSLTERPPRLAASFISNAQCRPLAPLRHASLLGIVRLLRKTGSDRRKVKVTRLTHLGSRP